MTKITERCAEYGLVHLNLKKVISSKKSLLPVIMQYGTDKIGQINLDDKRKLGLANRKAEIEPILI